MAPSADPSAAAPSARSGAMRLVTVQSAVELLLELTHDSSARPNLSESHARLLETAQACAARNLRRALNILGVETLLRQLSRMAQIA
jgi:hypothetical protein